MSQSKLKTSNTRSLTFVLIALVGITLIYQLRPFLDDAQFAWISVPTYSIIPGALVVIASILAIKLKKINHYQAKAYFLFAIGVACWFVAEQLWAAYDHIWEGEPFPSEADAFYIASYPFLFAFLLISLKPARRLISKNVLFFAIALSAVFLIPSFSFTFSDMEGELPFDTAVALTYPIASSALLVPAIIGIMFLFKLETNYSWMLMLFGFISYLIADTFFLFTIVDGSYYDGHPTDLVYLYSFILFIFSLSNRLKSINEKTDSKQTIFYSEKIKFETISKFGIPLTLVITSMIVIISMIHIVYFENEETLSLQNFMLGVVALLGVFIALIITINKNLTKLVHMRTEELQEQKNNLERLVAEKTQELLKQERLSAIGELSGRLAHDLRNPLSVMKMSIDLLEQQSGDKKISDPDVQKRIELIDKSITRISHQVDDVLEYVRNSPLRLANLSIHELLKKSIEKINVPDNIEISISDKDVNINCDPLKIDAVFINLIINAIHAMPNSGGKISINIIEQKDNVKIEFTDSGDGIPEHIIDKIFEPLFTTKQKGTGLGLASCKNIVEQHQGMISAKNNPTTFTIEMPKLLSQKAEIKT